MRILFYHASAFNKAPFCELLDEAERLYREGNEVYFATCGGAINACASNFTSNRMDCKVCQCSARSSLRMLSKGIHRIAIPRITTSYAWSYGNADELKHIVYKNVPIGYSVLSTYISQTRNKSPLIDEKGRRFFDHLLDEAAKLVDAIEVLYNEIKPDKLCVFNGRLFESSPIVQYAIYHKIRFDVYELLGGRGKPYHKIVFRDHIAHDIGYLREMIDSAWNNSKKPLSERESIGKSFFENRRNGIEAGDKVYISGQQKGLLPEDWDSTKRNIVIFNSSEDEYASIGQAYESYALYPSQIEGIKRMLELTKDNEDIHFYLRIHPNLGDITYSYHLDLYKLSEQYPNITVIPAKEKVSTYSLMDAAEKVIVFGSTMGAEAAYWGKAVILLAGAVYYDLGICHIPHTEEELEEMLKNAGLAPKACDREQCYKFGFYFLDSERSIRAESYEYFDYNPFEVKIGGKVFHGTNCQKTLGSSKLYAYSVAGRRMLARVVCKDSYVMPTEEGE